MEIFRLRTFDSETPSAGVSSVIKYSTLLEEMECDSIYTNPLQGEV